MSTRAFQVTNATSETIGKLLPTGVVRAIGVDAVEIEDFDLDLRSEDPSAFLASVFLEDEIRECAGSVERLAARFAAKEAVLKALGTGARGIGMTDVQISTDPYGRPTVALRRNAADVAIRVHIDCLRLSMTREAGLAIAVVVGLTTADQHDSNRSDE